MGDQARDGQLQRDGEHSGHAEQPGDIGPRDADSVQFHRDGQVELVVDDQAGTVDQRECQESAVGEHMPHGLPHLCGLPDAASPWQPDDLGKHDDRKDTCSQQAGQPERDDQEDTAQDGTDNRAQLGSHHLEPYDLFPGNRCVACLDITGPGDDRRFHRGREQCCCETDQDHTHHHPEHFISGGKGQESTNTNDASDENGVFYTETVSERTSQEEHALLGERSQSQQQADDPLGE